MKKRPQKATKTQLRVTCYDRRKFPLFLAPPLLSHFLETKVKEAPPTL